MRKNIVSVVAKTHAHHLGGAMLVGVLLNAFIKGEGDWRVFCSVVIFQIYGGQAFYNYVRGGWVALSPGGFDKDADPGLRGVVAYIGLAIYLASYFIDF